MGETKIDLAQAMDSMKSNMGSKAFQAEIYIDLGTANTLVMTRNKGLVANEPSVIAYRDLGHGAKQVVGVGNEAKTIVGRTPGNLVASFPLKEGVIADLDTTKAMLQYFMSKAKRRFPFTKPRIVVSLPYACKDIERRAVLEAGMDAGAKEVLLIEEPMAAAIGAGLPIHAPEGSVIIDIGGGTTDIAIISLYGIVQCESVRIGGYAFDQAIVDYIKKRHNLIIGDQSAERIKIEAGSAISGDHETKASIRGVDYASGLPKEVFVTSHEVNDAIEGLLEQIIRGGKKALAEVPPDLMPDIVHNGAVVAGGGALMRHMDQRLAQELGIKVRIAEDPLLAVARGGFETLRNSYLLEQIAI